MIDRIAAGPITVLLIGTCTNFAIFLMSNPHLKKNIKHIYIMGGGVRTKNPTGNLFTDYTSNPYAESNMFGDPFAAYQVRQFLDLTNNQSLFLYVINDFVDRLTYSFIFLTKENSLYQQSICFFLLLKCLLKLKVTAFDNDYFPLRFFILVFRSPLFLWMQQTPSQ